MSLATAEMDDVTLHAHQDIPGLRLSICVT